MVCRLFVAKPVRTSGDVLSIRNILRLKNKIWNNIQQNALDTSPRSRVEFGALQWRHDERNSVPNHQPHECLLNDLFGRRSKKTWKLCVTGLCAGNSPVPGEFTAQMASIAENVLIWWRHHVTWYQYVYSVSCDESMYSCCHGVVVWIYSNIDI